MSDVDHRFATIPDRAHRGIGGDSEGGYGAVNVALHHLGVFSVIQGWSAYFTQTPTGPFTGATPAALRANSPAAYVDSLAPAIHRLGLRAWLYQGRTEPTNPAFMRSFAPKSLATKLLLVTGSTVAVLLLASNFFLISQTRERVQNRTLLGERAPRCFVRGLISIHLCLFGFSGHNWGDRVGGWV